MSPSSSSGSAVAACKIEQDLSPMVSGGSKDLLSSGFQFGNTRKHSERSHQRVNSPLKVSKDSYRIRKPPLPLPQVQYRPPIIIHTYSPKIIHTQPDDFMSIVQKLTGSSNTRLSLKESSSKEDKQASTSKTVREETGRGQLPNAATIDLEREGSGDSSSATATNCGLPSSSKDSDTLLVTDQSCRGGAGEPATCIKQSNSPRSPLDSQFEFDNFSDSLFNQFSGIADPSAGSAIINPQVKAFSFLKSNPFNCFTDFMQHVPGVLQAATSKPASKPTRSRTQRHQHQDLMRPYAEPDNTVPSPGLLSPNLMPDVSSQGWSHSKFLDCLDGVSAPPGSRFVNQTPPLRQHQFSGPSYNLEGSTMVALENIHAFMLR
ncbi:hypothetical protein M758_6G154900 [Ceratodon purpureus]|nr:hypothetical protein M758_6G154900 [Ceratodon purpureus]